MAAIKVLCSLESESPISFSRHYEVDRLEKEQADDYEERTWRERLHYLPKTLECYIPPMMLKHCLSNAARYLKVKIPGRRGATYTPHFVSGVLVTDPLMLGIKRDEVLPLKLFVDARGRPGGSSRVNKYFPEIPQWKGEVTFYILDQLITEDVFREHIIEAGKFVGLGRFRPQNGGYYGRFTPSGKNWLKWNVNGK